MGFNCTLTIFQLDLFTFHKRNSISYHVWYHVHPALHFYHCLASNFGLTLWKSHFMQFTLRINIWVCNCFNVAGDRSLLLLAISIMGSSGASNIKTSEVTWNILSNLLNGNYISSKPLVKKRLTISAKLKTIKQTSPNPVCPYWVHYNQIIITRDVVSVVQWHKIYKTDEYMEIQGKNQLKHKIARKQKLCSLPSIRLSFHGKHVLKTESYLQKEKQYRNNRIVQEKTVISLLKTISNCDE